MSNKLFLKRGLFFMLAMVLVLGCNVAKADTTPRSWNFVCQSWGTQTNYVNKSGSGKVYCNPQKGHSVYVTVYGSTSSNGNGVICSNQARIPVGIEGYITNYVRENGYSYGSLAISRTTIDNTYCSGIWRVDATGYNSSNPNHIIYN